MTADAFFKELNKIIQSQPKLHSRSNDSENCDYGDQLYYCKNMSYSFDCLKSSDCVYMFDCHICANCCDCDYTIESQLCYECVDAFKCFNSIYLEDCTNVRDSAYSYNCKDCANVFGCVNVTSKSFCIFNRQLTESEYHEEVKKYTNLPPEKILAYVEELKNKYPRTQTHGENNENAPFGNYVYNCRNCYMCFDVDKSENSGYLYDSGGHKNCYDSTFSGAGQLSYEQIDSTNLFNCDFTIWSGYCSDSSYLLSCSNVKNSLGCVNLYQKEYCILNRQFTKEEYEVKSREILENLKEANRGWADLSF